MADSADERPSVPSELPLPRYPLASKTMGEAYQAAAERPTDPYAHTEPAPPEVQEPPPRPQWDRRAERLASGWVTLLFVASFLGSMLFCFAYVFMSVHTADFGRNQNLVLGTGLGVAMLGVGCGMVLLQKKLVPSVKAVQERHEHHSPEEHELAAEQQLVGGATEMGLGQRKFLRRAMLGALAALPLPFIVALRDVGPRPRALLRANAWKKGARLLDIDTLEPVKLGDVEIGGFLVVVPEGATDTELPIIAESAVNLIHLPPGVNHPLPGREDWAIDGLVAYSRICTHAGCPVSLFEQQTNFLLCPCHQSTFDVPHGCKVHFGPAARPLPQLPIYADSAGFIRCRRPFDVALGPSYWSRNYHGE